MYDVESYADLMARVERLERAAAFLIVRHQAGAYNYSDAGAL